MQLAREETAHNKTVGVLSQRVKELEQEQAKETQSKLQVANATEKMSEAVKRMEAKEAERNTAVLEKDVLTDEILAARSEMKKAGELIGGLEKELEIERALLGDAQKAKAQARWNLGAGKEKAEAFNRKLKFQGGLRQQMVAKTVEERESLVQELVRERKEKEDLARQRLETVEQLKASLNSQIDSVLNNLKVEMGEAEQTATRRGSMDPTKITKIAMENQKSSLAIAASAEPTKPAAPKKSGSILGAIGGMFGLTKEEDTVKEEAPTDDQVASEAAIAAAVSSMVSNAVTSAAAAASKSD